MPGKKYPNKHIEEALQYAESRGWRIEKSSGQAHSWGKMLCPENFSLCRNSLFCIKSIWSTPETHNNMPEILIVPLTVAQ